MPGRTAGQPVPLQQADRISIELPEVVGDARTQDAAANDDDVVVSAHKNSAPQAMSLTMTLKRDMVLLLPMTGATRLLKYRVQSGLYYEPAMNRL